ncbi:MAG: hypothetical protein DMG09_28495 [Acidobacteria bacterium]|nr:MAG: hypothetical protein DMG09_28495 [Acidobacteriota bacterium]
MRLTTLGIFLGILAAFWLTRWLSSLLFEITPLDPKTPPIFPLITEGRDEYSELGKRGVNA